MLNGKTKILILNDHLGYGNQIHGAARLFRLWAMHFDPSRYDVTIAILRKRNALSKTFEEKGIKVVFLGKSKYDPTALPSLLALVKQERPDIMHIQSHGATTLGRLAGILTGIPVLVHFHDTNPGYPWPQRVSDRLLGRFTDGYLAVSNSARDWWAQRCKLDPSKITVLHNCTSLDEFAPVKPESIEAEKRRLGIKPTSNVVGTVHRLFAEKGTDYLLEAAPRVLEASPDTMFVIVGDGPRRQHLAALAVRLGIQQKVIFTGYTEDVARFMGLFDINVVTSYHTEGGSPLPVLEAMAMAKPVVATNMVEIIEDGVTGFVIPPKDSAILAEKVIYLLQNKEEARRLGRNAKEASKMYDVRLYVQRLGQIYGSLIEERKSARR